MTAPPPVAAPAAERDGYRERALQAERLADAGLFTAAFAEDALNQLTLLLGVADRGLSATSDEDPVAALAEVRRRGAALKAALDDLLRFLGRRTAGPAGPAEAEFAIADAVASVERLLAPVCRAAGVAFLPSCAAEARVRGDRRGFERALVTVAMGAAAASARGGGRVALTAVHGAEGTVRVSVRDTGRADGPGRSGLVERFLPTARGAAAACSGSVAFQTGPLGSRIELVLPTVPPR